MTETDRKIHERDALIAITKLEEVDLGVLKDAWINLEPSRRHSLKRKLMALAFI